MAWLLAALLVLPATVRTIHLLEEEHASAQDAHTHHDCDSCTICHFALSAFTGTEAVVCEHSFVPTASEPITSFYNKPYSPTLLSYGLRAPPVIRS